MQIRPTTPRIDRSKYTPLQKHVDFFDKNQDGKVEMRETRQGLKELGAGGVVAVLGAAFINLFMGPMTSKKLTSVIDVGNIKGGKHDSDTDNYDDDGNFDPKAFDAMFAKYDTDRSSSLDADEIKAMRKTRAEGKLGQIAGAGEFGLLMSLAADGSKKVGDKAVPSISRARLQSFYDGHLFPELAAARKAQGK
jgi:peroxygenase